MKRIFIIDGYNVIHKNAELEAKLKENLESARVALAMKIHGWKRRYAEATAYIVFDGSGEDIFDEPHARMFGIDCIFTKSRESADDRIINMVQASEDPSIITVISDDNRVRNSCRGHGARVQNTSFLGRSKKPRVPADRKKYIDNYKLEREITDYYRNYLISKGLL